MDDPEVQTDSQLVSGLFALLTAKFEDAAALAATCQAADAEVTVLRSALRDLASLGEETATLVAVTERLLR